MIGLLISSIIIVFVLISLFGAWYTIGAQHYGSKIKPGDSYMIGEDEYVLDGSMKMLNSHARALKPEYLSEMKQLLKVVVSALEDNCVDYRVSGGTLLGLKRHGTFIPWDDDLDLHVDLAYREFLFSKKFADDAGHYGLECIFLPGASHRRATKEGAACRMRFVGSVTPVCDVFFTETKNGKVYKIDSWKYEKNIYSNKEIWPETTIYPTVKKEFMKDVLVRLPAVPEKVLFTQYGKKCLQECASRHTLISHNTPFLISNFLWKKNGL